MTASARPGDARLPLERDSFVGRRGELAEVRRLLSRARLVTLVGPGGVGKTRLAVHAAHVLGGAYADGVTLIELADVTHPERLLRTVAATLGLREPVTGVAPQSLTSYLADRSVLLLLDNCEHLVDGVAALADSVLRTCPGVRLLATSREALRTTGESVLQVNPLAVPSPHAIGTPESLLGYEAVALFAARARAAVPGFDLDARNVGDVAAIVESVDGLPLAIELAAARLRTLSPRELAHRLADPLRLLQGGRRDSPRRHQTLRDSVEWSYANCTTEERLLWSRLSVFLGGFEVDAAEGVCGYGELPAHGVFEVLSALVEKSVVTRVSDGEHSRFRMLNSLRDYGAERLRDLGETAEAGLRHSRWYSDLVHHTRTVILGPDLPEHWRRLDREHSNLEAAFDRIVAVEGAPNESARWVASLWGYWMSRGTISLGRAWVERALVDDDAQPDHDLLRATYIAAALAGFEGDLALAGRLVVRARELATELGDDLAGIMAEQAAGWVARATGQFAEAVVHLRRASDFYRENQDEVRLAEALCGLIATAGLSGDLPQARGAYAEVMAICDAYGGDWFRAYAAANWGAVLWMTGDRAEVQAVLEQCLEAGARVDEFLAAVEVLPLLAALAAHTAEPERAAVLLGAAAALTRDLGITRLGIPAHHAHREGDIEDLKRSLGIEGYQRAFDRGWTMDHVEAVQYASRRPPAPKVGETSQPSPPIEETVAASPLTRREQEVAELVSLGLTNKEVAAELVVSPRTVRGHVENILAKLDFSSRAQIASWYARNRSA